MKSNKKSNKRSKKSNKKFSKKFNLFISSIKNLPSSVKGFGSRILEVLHYRTVRFLMLYAAVLVLFLLPAVFFPIRGINLQGIELNRNLLLEEVEDLEREIEDLNDQEVLNFLADEYPERQKRWYYFLEDKDGNLKKSSHRYTDQDVKGFGWHMENGSTFDRVISKRRTRTQDRIDDDRADKEISRQNRNRSIYNGTFAGFRVLSYKLELNNYDLWLVMRPRVAGSPPGAWFISLFIFFIFLAFVLLGAVLAKGIFTEVNIISKEAKKISTTNDLKRRLAIKNSKAKDEFSKLKRDWNKMLDRIQQQNTNLKHQASNIAHDLRTPLARIRLMLEGAKKSKESSESLEEGKNISKAIEECDDLLVRFNALLHLSSIEEGNNVPFKATHLKPLALDAIDFMKPLAEEKNQDLSYDISSAKIDGNKDLLSQALINLLDNAIKFTPNGGKIFISIKDKPTERIKHAEGLVYLTVSDSGQGIDKKDRANVFVPFFRGDKSRASKGYGLGLSTVDAVVRAHNGEIKLTKSYLGGLGVVCIFPVYKKKN